MRQTTTDSRVIEEPVVHTCCTVNSAGQHEADCPCHIDRTEIVWTPEGARLLKDYRGQYVVWRYEDGLFQGRLYNTGAGSSVGTNTQTMGV